MTSRLDIQLPNAMMYAAYNSNGGVQLAPDHSDPFDTSGFPSSQYPYAFEVFGNNGTTPRLSPATSSSNHSLDDLTNTTPNATTVYSDIVEVTGSNFVGSDHYPIVGDYLIVTNAVVTPPGSITLMSRGFGTNGNFQLQLTSSASTGFEIQVSTNLNTWTNIGSGATGTNGVLLFQDTNAAGLPQRYYRAFWPIP